MRIEDILNKSLVGKKVLLKEVYEGKFLLYDKKSEMSQHEKLVGTIDWVYVEEHYPGYKIYISVLYENTETGYIHNTKIELEKDEEIFFAEPQRKSKNHSSSR